MKLVPDCPSTGVRPRRLSRKKLLFSKWTAVTPLNSEKHFVVTQVIDPARSGVTIGRVELRAVHSGRCMTVDWSDLTDSSRWQQGWS